ncbi:MULTISPECIES: ATP-binding protein [unclassified Duganella]|uniref:ATP-binding protein n=1 Tax=unclassified Duganella TaxID=2636909 RepID=UPI000E35535B|nr:MULTISPECIES: ATP-binding protein [unclassified Duganella]RFP16175.1 response regulator [Duganella sp. BJB475]RFP32662.1 response regulator [Duganella sp. BJB476]
MDTMSSWFGSQGFMPHGHCFLWTPSILWLSVISDALIALAYLTIPITLLYFIRKRRDLPFDWMFIAFGIFILACGSTHVADIWVIWHPDYWLSVILKSITAAASVVTAIVLVRLVPVALRIPSPAQLEAVNAELQRANAELRIAMERAEVANRAKSAFLAAMSHELRTPLNAILGYTQILKRDKALTPTQKSGVGTIQQGGQHLLALINDVLDLSRVEAGKMDFHPKPVVLADLLSVVADIMRVRAEQKHLHFELELAAGLPEAISVDETRLRQVLLNLLGNAVKFTDRGTVRLRVLPLPARPGAAPDAAALRFEVHDDGIGIAPGHIDAIFRPFEQVGDASRRAGGTGLGLAISGQLVRLMGGELKVESMLGTGSRFWFDVAMPVVAAPAAISSDGHNATGYLGPRKTILVVDDVATNRALLRDLLGALDFRMLEADNGADGLLQAQSGAPDLVLLDMVMPDMDGIETTRRLRADARTSTMPVLMISASSTPEEEERSRQVGANAFLSKPVDELELLREIGAHLKLEWSTAPE